MQDVKDPLGEMPLINTDKLSYILNLYKFPLILSGIGALLLLLSVSLLVKTQDTPDVIFSSEASVSAKSKLQVDIQGAVMTSGVYELDEGSRIIDALASAGGLSADADRSWLAKNLNQAAKIIDGGKIYIPSVNEVNTGKIQNPKSQIQGNLSNLTSSNALGITSALININTASKAELEALPGIGPVTADKIIAGRLYQTVEELKSRKIIGQSLYNKIKDLLTVF